MTAIRRALQRRYAAPEFHLFEEFALFEGGRRLDAVAVSPWAARGFAILGFEIKEQRADWLRELRNSSKAEEGAAFCDRWSVAAPKDVVKASEVPAGWGFVEMRGERLFNVIEAPVRVAVPIDRAFLARVITHLSETSERLERDFRHTIRKEISDEIEESHRAEIERIKGQSGRRAQDLEDAIAVFEKASGIRIAAYNGPRVGEVVKAALEVSRLPNLEYQENHLQVALDAVKKARAEITAVNVAPLFAGAEETR